MVLTAVKFLTGKEMKDPCIKELCITRQLQQN